jgi:hypothetical protein
VETDTKFLRERLVTMLKRWKNRSKVGPRGISFDDEKWVQLAEVRIPLSTSGISCKAYSFSASALQISQLLTYYEVNSIQNNGLMIH